MMNAAEWNHLIADLPGTHLLQTWEWGQLKSAVGWEPLQQVWRAADGRVQAAALVLQRSVSLAGIRTPLSVLYVPRGPLLDWADADLRQRVLDDLQQLARRQRALFIKVDPELALGCGIPGSTEASEDATGQAVVDELTRRGWRFSPEQIQFRNTVWLDLHGEEEDWLGRMKQKTRYNLRLAERKGVRVRTGTQVDLPVLYHMYAETSVRDGFVIRPEQYYLQVWQTYMQAGMATPLIAEVEGEAVAAVVVFHFAGRAWYLHGMSRQQHREKMPNYLLQWEAMRLAKLHGCTVYDLWGAPDEFCEADSMWGVFRFKEGLGGEVVRTLGAWDYPVNSGLYHFYQRVLPRLLDVMRRRGKAKTQQEVGS